MYKRIKELFGCVIRTADHHCRDYGRGRANLRKSDPKILWSDKTRLTNLLGGTKNTVVQIRWVNVLQVVVI